MRIVAFTELIIAIAVIACLSEGRKVKRGKNDVTAMQETLRTLISSQVSENKADLDQKGEQLDGKIHEQIHDEIQTQIQQQIDDQIHDQMKKQLHQQIEEDLRAQQRQQRSTKNDLAALLLKNPAALPLAFNAARSPSTLTRSVSSPRLSKATTVLSSADLAAQRAARTRMAAGVEDFGDGLRFKESKAGDGKTFPQKGDKLTMHYILTLADGGKKVDSSRDRGQPFTFTIGVKQVIAGWDKGVMQMSLGQRGTLFVPSALGYGDRGFGPDLPPNSDLKFDVEVLEIENGNPVDKLLGALFR